MATPANIIINSGSSPFTASISHDGNPETVLKLLANFLEQDETANPYSAFTDVYYANYRQETRDIVSIQPDVNASADWTYLISDSDELFVLWPQPLNSAAAPDALCDPMEYLNLVTDDFKEQVEASIRSSISRLAALGVSLKIPESPQPASQPLWVRATRPAELDFRH